MKKRAVLLAAMAALYLCGCAKGETAVTENKTAQESSGESKKETASPEGAEASQAQTEKADQEEAGDSQVSQDFRDHFSEITINGTTLQFPISYKDFTAAGFEMQSTYKDVVHRRQPIGGTACWKEGENNFFAVDISQNSSDDKINVEDGDIVSFTWDRMSYGGQDVTFYGGIHADSTREEVGAVLEEIDSDDSSASYELFLDEDKTMGLYVLFLGDELTTVNLYTDYANEG